MWGKPELHVPVPKLHVPVPDTSHTRQSSLFRVCIHCDKTLGAKAYKQHRRRYFHDGTWMRTNFVNTYKERSPRSSDKSSPISITSDPPSLDFHLTIFNLAFLVSVKSGMEMSLVIIQWCVMCTVVTGMAGVYDYQWPKFSC